MFPLACTGRRGRAQPIFQSHRNHKAQSPDIFQVIQSGFDQVDADNLICKKPEWTMINSIQLHNYYASTEFEQMLSVENIIACQATSRFYELAGASQHAGNVPFLSLNRVTGVVSSLWSLQQADHSLIFERPVISMRLRAPAEPKSCICGQSNRLLNNTLGGGNCPNCCR